MLKQTIATILVLLTLALCVTSTPVANATGRMNDSGSVNLSGTVRIDQLTPSTLNLANIPVDVVQVLDTSGSMGDPFNGSSSSNKLQAAKAR